MRLIYRVVFRCSNAVMLLISEWSEMRQDCRFTITEPFTLFAHSRFLTLLLAFITAIMSHSHSQPHSGGPQFQSTLY